MAAAGPGRLLGTVHWVRHMVEHIARLTGAAERGDGMAVERVEETPDKRTAADRSNAGLEQYAATHCAAVVAEIVRERFGGDWLAAEIAPEEVRAAVLERVARHLDASEAPAAAVSRFGLDSVRCVETEAARNARSLARWLTRQEEEAEEAARMLTEAGQFARHMAGEGDESASGGSGAESGAASGAAAA